MTTNNINKKNIDKNKTYSASLEIEGSLKIGVYDTYWIRYCIMEIKEPYGDPILVDSHCVSISSEEFDGVRSGLHQYGDFLPAPYNCVMGDDNGGFWEYSTNN